MAPDPHQDTVDIDVDALIETLSGEGGAPRQAPGETIQPAQLPAEAARRSLELLKELFPKESRARMLRVESLLGRGGMGEVHLAEQVSMERKVAVKTLRDDMSSEPQILKLLHEGWVTGYLEHPNIIPVYDIRLDANDRPLILLKRVDGVTWLSLMDDAHTVRERFGADDLLEWNLRVLGQVCDALNFAHSRGIVHRDVKPENVMIGEFGEVYLVDWGIALGTRREHAGRVALAEHAHEVAGTPCYMAPEMLGGPKSELGPRTDVYQLGAVLFELVTGDPPHLGEHLRDTIASIVRSPPAMPPSVPQELANICRRAMSASPGDRFETPLAFKRAIEEVLSHRGSRQLARQARGRLQLLQQALDTPASEANIADRHLELHNAFAECRFAFRESLKAWPGNAAANEGLRRATGLLAEYELRIGDPKAASTLLASLEDAPAELAGAVADALAAKEVADRKLRELHAQHDETAGSRTRGFVAMVLGCLWTFSPFIFDARFAAPTRELIVITPLLLLAVGVALGIWARETLGKSPFNQRLAMLVALTFLLQLALGLVSYVVPIPIPTIFTLWFLIWAGTAGAAAATLERRLWLMPIGFAAGMFLSASYPDYNPWIMSGSQALLTLHLIVLWGADLRRPAAESGGEAASAAHSAP